MDTPSACGRKVSPRPMRVRHHPNLKKYAQLTRTDKTIYLRWRAHTLKAEQAVVDLDVWAFWVFDMQTFLKHLEPEMLPRLTDQAAISQARARLLYCVQQLPPFDDLRTLHLAPDGRSLRLNRDMRAAHIQRQREFHAMIAPAAALAGQLRLTRSAPAVSASAPTPRLHRYVVHHFAGIFNGAETDSAVYFSQDQHAQRLAERQRRAQAELRRHALAAHQVQPRQYRRHPPVHARSWHPKPRAPQQCSSLSNSQRAEPRPSALPLSPPVNLAPPLAATPTPATPLDSPVLPASATAPTSKADYPDSDAMSAASTVDLLAALLTLLRFVHGTPTPARRRPTRSAWCTMGTRQIVPSATTDWMFRTAPTLGRWTCVSRDCRKARSSLSLHCDCTDGTGTRPSFEPR